MKSRKFSSALVSAVLLVIGSNMVACGVMSFRSPTATPTSTNTLVPTGTNTPLPTSTDTPVPPTATPTSTPNLEATQAAQQEQTARDMLTQLELPSDIGHLVWHQDEAIAITLEGQQYDYDYFADNVFISDFVLYSEMTWKTNGWPTCGAWFRVNKHWDIPDYYVLQFLRFSGLPAWDIEYIKGGDFVSNITEKVRFSKSFSIQDGATNKFVLAATGNEFKVFINDTFIGRYYDYSSKLTQGGFAFTGSQSSGDTTCTFENSWIWTYR
jgi:hypothetical protein